ncbi:complement C1q subcomponent subunit C-like [Babylonia areolata]|uniref:complement C1q subcomponent subunit C-like n=1 Tax=Babylonia areolata TaxID=304850 RepID=UPI003FD5C868
MWTLSPSPTAKSSLKGMGVLAVTLSGSQPVTLVLITVFFLFPAPKQTASFRTELAVLDEVTARTPIPFKLDFAVGEGDYNQTTGVYTVAVPGVYSFGFQLYPKRSTSYHITLFVNSSKIILSRCHSNEYSTSCAASTLLRVQKGDRVWVEASYGRAYGSGYGSYFFGALVSPDP